MDVSINIKVLDPFWMEMEKENPDHEQHINPYDVEREKFLEFVSFDFDSNIDSYNTKRDIDYELPIRIYDEEGQRFYDETIWIKDVTLVEFVDKIGTNRVVISNDLIVSFFGAQKSGKKYYWYVFIDGNADYHQQMPNIWLNRKTLDSIIEKYPDKPVALLVNKQPRKLKVGKKI